MIPKIFVCSECEEIVEDLKHHLKHSHNEYRLDPNKPLDYSVFKPFISLESLTKVIEEKIKAHYDHIERYKNNPHVEPDLDVDVGILAELQCLLTLIGGNDE